MSHDVELTASLPALVGQADREAQRYEADLAGGGKVVRRRDVRCEHVTVAADGDAALRVHCEAVVYHGDQKHIADRERVVFIECVPPAAGLPPDWRGWARLELDVLNGQTPMGVELVVYGARSRLPLRRDLAPGEAATLAVDLRDLPLTSGILPFYEPQAIRVAFHLKEGGPAGECRLLRLALAGRREIGPVLDRYGQRMHADWPGKVRADADLVRAREEEGRALAALAPVAGRGRYGGWTGGPRFAASGFFRVEQDARGRWWYADPEGLPFWSTGPTGVRLGDATTIAGREEAFTEIRRDAPDFAWDDAKRFRFYASNVYHKYGSIEAWCARLRERFAKWGPNTVANWSDARVSGGKSAYVKSLGSRVAALSGRFAHMPDVFDAAWEPALRRHFEAEAGPLAQDPWLIGYFVDNEMPWRGMSTAEAEAYAEQYFSTIRRVLKSVDPNHLYLGCRFVREMPDPVIAQAAGRHVDVLSVNAYSIVPRKREFDAWFRAARRPIQIGEHQWALNDPRGVQTPWITMTAEERRAAVVRYSETAARLPYCLGTHWFQFEDQPLTGRPSNGENMLIGLVDITDQPYPHMISAFREIAERCYAWHEEAK